MDQRKYLTCLWPGLSELWWRGRLESLPLAIGFAVALNALLILTFLHPGWLAPFLVRAAWWIGVIAWGYWTIKSFGELPAMLEPRSQSEVPDRFVDAHAAYLKEDWQVAEKLLLTVLAIEPRDPPALLLLSGVYRHTQRFSAAAAILDELSRLEVGDSWSIEIAAESARIERDVQNAPEIEEGNESDAGNAAAARQDDWGTHADLTAA